MHIGLEELSLVAVFGVIIVVAISMLAGRLGIATPLILVLVGIGLSYIPGVPLIQVDPEIILLVILPPILYAAAVNVPVIDLRRNVGPISALSVLLVIISALTIGALVHWLVPEVPFAAAVALGAVVGPTDAVAATAIGKRLGMPPRLVTILEGESLVNDATALVLLRTAVVAVTSGFVFWQAAGQFVYAVVVALAFGLLVGVVTVWVRSNIQNPVYDTVISFAVPFISFVPAEYVGASGVLAVVVTGLYSGHHAARKFTATARINERLNWRTAQFLLENGVFLLMGLEMHALIVDVRESSVALSDILLYGVIVAATLIVLRMLFMLPVTWGLARSLSRYEAKANAVRGKIAQVGGSRGDGEPTETQAMHLQRLHFKAKRHEADAAHAHEQGLDLSGAVILGWSGMRGVVTLAAAQSIPTTVPFRSQIVLVAFFAAIITLLLHGLTLPSLIRKLRPQGPSASDQSQELISLYQDLVEVGDVALESAIEHEIHDAKLEPDRKPPSEAVKDRARSSVHNSIASLAFAAPQLDPNTVSDQEADTRCYMRLAHAALDAQRKTLLEERAIGQYSSQALRAAEEALDRHEMRLSPAVQQKTNQPKKN